MSGSAEVIFFLNDLLRLMKPSCCLGDSKVKPQPMQFRTDLKVFSICVKFSLIFYLPVCAYINFFSKGEYTYKLCTFL